MVSEKSVNNYQVIDISDASDDDAHSNADPNSYFRNLDLSIFVAEPLRMLDDHDRLKEQCLENDNTEAHYIEGILQYFVHNQKRIGMMHLRRSAWGNYPNGMYLYGLLMLAEDHYPTGKKYLDKLQWKKKRSTSDQCWESIKKSLREIPVTMKKRYHVNMVNITPRTSCDPDNMAKVCKHCYYFKRLTQFVNFATNKKG